MARGKHGDRAAGKREDALREHVAQLEAQLDNERREAHERYTALQAEHQKVHGDISRRVREVSQEAILATKLAARAEATSAKADADSRVLQTLQFLVRKGRIPSSSTELELRKGDWAELVDLTGLPPHVVFTALGMKGWEFNHAGRRASTKKFRSALTGTR